MYDNPLTITHKIADKHDFGAGGDSISVTGPAGATGVLRHIGVSCVGETFTNVTTGALVQVGTAADVDAYAELDVGALADTNSVAAADTDFTDRSLPADTPVEVTFVAPTGGTPAGIGNVEIVIDWNAANPKVDP